MIKFLIKNWFLIGVGLAVPLGLMFPKTDIMIRKSHILNIGIFIIFLYSGINLDTAVVKAELKNYKTPIVALLSALVLFPALIYLPAEWLYHTQPDFIIGILLIATAPVTIASGNVMTMIAGGNVSLSLIICLACNFAAILTIPYG